VTKGSLTLEAALDGVDATWLDPSDRSVLRERVLSEAATLARSLDSSAVP
jgi:hypothetical protein